LLLSSGVCILMLIATFEVPGVDLSSLPVFKVAWVPLPVTKFSYKTDGTISGHLYLF
jgi:hypothetical protein